MSKPIKIKPGAKTRTPTAFEVRQVDENAWKATVISHAAMYVRDYEAALPGWRGYANDGAPTLEVVREDWKHDRGAFRNV